MDHKTTTRLGAHRCAAWATSLVLASAGIAGCGDGGDGPPGDVCPANPAAFLAEASAGDVLSLPGCELAGPIALPAGVTIGGTSDEPLVVTGAEGDPAAISFQGGAGDAVTVLHDTEVRGRATVGVLAQSAGEVRIEDVTVDTEWGLGIVLDALPAASLSDVVIEGAGPNDRNAAADPVFVDVNPNGRINRIDDCPDVADPCTVGQRFDDITCSNGSSCEVYSGICDPCGRVSTTLTTTGLFTRDVETLTLNAVNISRFAQFGAVLVGDEDASVTWTGGSVRATIGIGIYVAGPAATLEDVSVVDLFAGLRQTPAFGILQASEADRPGALVGRNIEVADSELFGIYQQGGAADYDGLDVSNTATVAVWVRDTDNFCVTNGTVTDGAIAGIAMIEPTEAVLDGLVVRGTKSRTTMVSGLTGDASALTAGDGLHLVRANTNVRIANALLEENERIGIAVLLGPDEALTEESVLCAANEGLCFEEVTVRGIGEQRGALAGSPVGDEGAVVSYAVVPDGAWAEGIEREGSALADVDAIDDLPGVGVVGPLDAPDPRGVVGPLD